MSDLGILASEGYVSVVEAPTPGMVTLRCRDGAALTAALKGVGLTFPDHRGRSVTERGEVLWMSPDELLLLLPPEDVARMIATLGETLGGVPALIVDVSDARVMFRLTGAGAGEVLSKISPALLPARGEVRRSRIGQIAAAFWRSGDAEMTVICFRSVAGYARDLLSHAARRESQIDPV